MPEISEENPRMQPMRWLVTLLICLSLPLQGAWSLAAPVEPCPMEGMVMASNSMVSDAHMDADAVPDCCNDEATFLKTGQPCKTGMDCGAPMASVPPGGLSAAPALQTTRHLALNVAGPPSSARSAIWRPPSLG
jgi:hypothetical protein